jgi:hypothetical protein
MNKIKDVIGWILSAMLFIVIPMIVITILDNSIPLFFGTITLVIAIILIGLFCEQSPYADDVYCKKCSKVTKQRVVVPGLRFMPKFECKECSTLNDTG